MHVLREWDLQITVDQVLRAQGADPKVVHQRSHKLVELSERALKEGMPLLTPIVAYREMKVKTIQHERLILSEGGVLSGKALVRHLAGAKYLLIIACTIGNLLEEYVSGILKFDSPYGLALDGLGSAAIETLAVQACAFLGEHSQQAGLQATLPFSPGMEGWPTGAGQQQVFRLVEADTAGIRLLPSGMMIPQKSLTMVVGLGPEVDSQGRVCDYCNMRQSCRYQDQYA